MCGIVGYIGNGNINDELLNSLLKLEYRGYDSAGVAVLENNKIKVTKAEGKIANLINSVAKTNATVGIAHTRWATHGKPTVNNAHPHISNNNCWAVVHNGIIENFTILKHKLSDIKFASDTDTEVIAQMLGKQRCKDNMKAVINVCNKLSGSFAIACINSDSNHTLYLAKQKSPLYIAINNKNVYVASDPICFEGKTNEYYAFEDGEYAKATSNNIEFYNKEYKPIKKQTVKLVQMQLSSEKQKYDHFMQKEIAEVPEVLKRIVLTYNDNNVLNWFNKGFINKLKKIAIVGCGTAYHAGLMGAKYFENLARVNANAYIASEFRYSNPILDKNCLCIFVSQSGETADTLACVELAKQKGCYTIALTNVLYSTLAKCVNKVLPVCAGPEIAVASTKAYTAQIAIFYLLANKFKELKFNVNTNCLNKLNDIANLIKMPKYKDVNKYAKLLTNVSKAFFLGRGVDWYLAEEASLKLKEISYINSSAHPTGELKHGFLALIEQDTVVFVIATQKDLLEKTLNGCFETASRGGKIILITPFKLNKQQTKQFYGKFKLNCYEDDLMPIEAIGFFQTLAYLTSINKGINPDQPRNLAKSVTVE